MSRTNLGTIPPDPKNGREEDMTYKIEVQSPTSHEWVLIELLEASITEIIRRVQKIKQVYPEYLVRALDSVSAKTIALA